MVTAHQFDALVMVPNCDKNVPGLLMAAARLNVPTIFCLRRPHAGGRLEDGRRTCLSHMFEAVGAYHAGTLDEAGVREYMENACPSCGSCSGMYTANSMNCLTEAIGMACRATAPSLPPLRPAAAGQARGDADYGAHPQGHQAPGHYDPRGLPTTPRRWTWPWAAPPTPCSTSRHRPRGGVEIDLDMANAISAQTPQPLPPGPAGPTYIEDLDRAGGVLAVMKELTKKNLLDTSLMTCTGKTIAENLEGVENRDPAIIRPWRTPTPRAAASPCSKGNLAP